MKKRTNEEKRLSLFLDSGAYSAFTKGVTIDIQEYIKFIKDYSRYIDIYANLDVIGDAEATWQNQKVMEAAGLHPMPCFHMGEDFSYLRRYVDNYEYIALGGVAQGGSNVQPWMDRCFEIICDRNGYPKCKVHGFAVTSLRLMLRYPWYSVDSTAWVMQSRSGAIYVPRYKNGAWIYDENSWKIHVSLRSPHQTAQDKHINTLSKNVRIRIEEYIHMKRYKIGHSEFKTVKADRPLQPNERWYGAKKKDSMRDVEIIIEPGLCNSYKMRDEMNIIYFMDLEKNMPEWPWPFKKRGVQGVAL